MDLTDRMLLGLATCNPLRHCSHRTALTAPAALLGLTAMHESDIYRPPVPISIPVRTLSAARLACNALTNRQSVYLVKSDHLPFMKIGRWSGTLGALQSRYHSVYSKDISMYTFAVNDGKLAEKVLKTEFASHRVSGELYRVDEDTPMTYYVQQAAAVVS